MSQLVAKWGEGYRFTDEELASLMDIQESLNEPFRAKSIDPEVTKQYTVRNYHDWAPQRPKQKREHFNVPEGIKTLFRLSDDIKQLNSLIMTLQASLTSLKKDHEIVKSKAVLMQDLWDGLLNQRSVFETFADQLEERLAPYLDADRLQDSLRIEDPMEAPLTAHFQDALQSAIRNAHLIMSKPEYKEYTIYAFKYKQLLLAAFSGFKTMFDRKMTELNLLCREQDSPIDSSIVNSRYEEEGMKLKPLLSLLQDSVGLDANLAQMLHDCLSKYLATRYNLAKRSRNLSISNPESVLQDAFNSFDFESDLMKQFFGETLSHQRHLEYFCDQLLLVLQERIKTYLSALPDEARSNLVQLEPKSSSTFAKTLAKCLNL